MAYFHYSAVTQQGELVRGRGEFSHAGELVDSLRARNLTLYRSTAVPRWAGAGWRKLGARMTAEFCYFLSQYLRAGADLRLALLDMTQSAPSARVRSYSRLLIQRIERGDALSVALRATRGVPPMVVTLAGVGEQTGKLETVLAAAAQYYEDQVQMRSALRRALMYPLLALIMLLAAVAFWVGYVLPQLAGLFSTLMPQLPPATRRVLDGAAWLRLNWPALVLALALLAVALPLLLQLRALRPAADRVRWHLPLLWRLERSRTYHLFFANFGVMYGAGMTMTRVLDVLLADPGNRRFGRQLVSLLERIRRGSPLSQAMQASRGFESIATGMVKLGEATGTLGAQCERLGVYYREKLKSQTDFIVRLFEPMVLLVIGILLALVVITVISPIYDLAQLTTRGIRP